MSLLPTAPLKLVRYPRLLAATLAVLSSMSLIPFAPFALRVTFDSESFDSFAPATIRHNNFAFPQFLSRLPCRGSVVLTAQKGVSCKNSKNLSDS